MQTGFETCVNCHCQQFEALPVKAFACEAVTLLLSSGCLISAVFAHSEGFVSVTLLMF